MKNKVLAVLGVIVILLIIGYTAISGVWNLMNVEDQYDLKLYGAFSLVDIEHSINGIIPIGTDHFFIGVENGTGKFYLIKGPVGWYTDNFDEDGLAKNKNEVTVNVLKQNVSDSDVRKAIDETLKNDPDIKLEGGNITCYNAGYKLNSVLRILAGAFALIIAIVGLINKSKFSEQLKVSTFGKVYIALIAAAALFILLVII